MLSYTLNNRPLAIGDASIRITWVNPACMFDRIIGDIGQGIEIPVNDINRAIFGNPERFEKYASDNEREFEGFEVRFKGSLLLGGTIIIQNATSENYSGWLRSMVGNIGKLQRDKYINEIAAFDVDQTFVNKANYNPLTDDYGCPTIFNPDFFKDIGRKVPVQTQVPNPDYYEGSGEPAFIEEETETEAFTEAFRKSAAWFVNKLNPDYTVKNAFSYSPITSYEDNFDVYVVSPMLFLNYILKTIFRDVNIVIDNDCIADHDDLKKLIVYSNYDAVNMGFDGIGFDIKVVDWAAGNSVQNYVKKVNAIYRDLGTFKYKNLIPKVSFSDWILSTQNELNVCFHFKNNGKVDIIDRETIIDGDSIDVEKYKVGTWEMGEKKDVTLKFMFTHDTDDTLFQERWEDIDEYREDEKAAVDTWDDLADIEDPDIGEVRYIKSVNLYAQYVYLQVTTPDPKGGNEFIEDVLGWKHLAMGFQNGFFNREIDVEEVFVSLFSTLMGGSQVSTYQRGNINSIKLPYQNFSPRFLFYNGNNSASFETANISLDWEKDVTGLLKTRWPIWSRFWSTRQPANCRLNLPLNMIEYISQNITKKLRVREGEFIIEEMVTEFGLHSISETKIKGYKI